MRYPEFSPDEAARLRALAEYGIDHECGLSSLDSIVDMAARLFRCPSAAVKLVGQDRVVLASGTGPNRWDMRPSASFCAHTIQHDAIMVVEDAALDPRFSDNPLVKNDLVRFYAGIALRAPSGHALGALCVTDTVPRTDFSLVEAERLRELGRLVAERLELRRLEVAAARPGEFRARAHVSPAAILCCDARGRLSAANPAAERLFGMSERELVGASFDLLVAEPDQRRARARFRRAMRGALPLPQGTRVEALRADGTTFPAQVHWSGWHEAGEPQFGLIVQDLSDARAEAEALHHLASHDPLTDLPNRMMLHEAIEQILAGSGPPGGRACGLVLTDLAGFADIANTLGQGIGDAVLVEASTRIRGAAPAGALVARVGGASFATLVVGRDPLVLGQAARRIASALAQPLWVEGQTVHLGSHAGLAMAPDNAETADDLIGNAELALLQAREQGRGETRFFTPQLRARAVARRMFEAELHRALGGGQFVLHYQPQVALSTGRLAGAEALIRWQHPERGLLHPAAFLPALEDSSAAADVGWWVLDTACAQAALWRRTRPDLCISVNLSNAQLQAGNLPAIVAATLADRGLPACALELEITENILLDQEDAMLSQLSAVRSTGVSLSFDDFGTGFASLNLLRNYPVSQIKIDKSFIQAMETSTKDRAIVLGLIRMAGDLGLEVTAEGVEDLETAEDLARHGCDRAQGYFFGQPCAAASFVDKYLRVESMGRQAQG